MIAPGRRWILGIDPGLSGALAWLDVAAGMLLVEDMPTARYGERTEIDQDALARLFDQRGPETRLAILEAAIVLPQGRARPGGHARGQSVADGLKIGQNWGLLRGLLAAHFVHTVPVPPREWKQALGLTGRDKDASRALAAERWPAAAHLFARKKDDGRAEAALLVWWGCCELR